MCDDGNLSTGVVHNSFTFDLRNYQNFNWDSK